MLPGQAWPWEWLFLIAGCYSSLKDLQYLKEEQKKERKKEEKKGENEKRKKKSYWYGKKITLDAKHDILLYR